MVKWISISSTHNIVNTIAVGQDALEFPNWKQK